MPRLLLFAPCERVILGQGDNSASLIVIIQELQFHGVLQKDQDIPNNAAVFARFSIFSQWYKSPGDEGRTFEQRIVLSLENEKPILEAVTEFQMTERLHRQIVQVSLLPVMKPGEYSLKLFMREKGQSEWFKPTADYPLNVVHSFQLQPQT